MNKLQAAEAMVIYKRKNNISASLYYSEQHDDYVCQAYGVLTDDYEKLLDCPIDDFGALHPGDATDEELVLWIAEELIPEALEKKWIEEDKRNM